MPSILFVCTGNICRSPMAEGIFAAQRSNHQALTDWQIDSAGIYAELGRPPEPHAVTMAAEFGATIAELRSRPFVAADFSNFDHIVAMDHGHLDFLCATQSKGSACNIAMLQDSAGQRLEIDDPYGQGLRTYRRIGDLLVEGIARLVSRLAADV